MEQEDTVAFYLFTAENYSPLQAACHSSQHTQSSMRVLRGLRLPFQIIQFEVVFYGPIPMQASTTIHEQSSAIILNFRIRDSAYSHARNPYLIPTCITLGVNFANICLAVKSHSLTSKSSCHVQKIFVNNAYRYHYCRDRMEFLR